MVNSVLQRNGSTQAAARLGGERAGSGVGLTEALDDLQQLYTVAELGDIPLPIVRAFTEEWAEATTGGFLGRSALDATTGLSTYDYLAVRLSEVYAENQPAHQHVSETRCFVFLDGATDMLHGWNRVARSNQISRLMMSVFNRGETNTVLPRGTVVSLAYRDDTLPESLARLAVSLRSEVPEDQSDARPLRRPRAWIEPLPEKLHRAEELLLRAEELLLSAEG